MPAETPAERGRRLVDGHDDGHDDLDDAADDDHDDDHDGSARRVDRITRPRRSMVSSVCGRSGTPPAVRNAAAGPSTRWCRTARRGSRPRQRRERYCSRVREPRLAFGSLRYMPAAAAAGSFLYIGVFQQSCRPAYGSPSRFSGVNVLGASAPPVISTCRVNTPVRRGLGMSRSAPPNAYPKGCTACTAGCSSEAPYDRALVGVAVGVGAYRRQPRGTVGAARAAERPLTEWVNVIAFSDRTRHLSSQFDKSQMIAVMGKSRWSRTRPGRASPRSAGRLTPRISSRTRARPAERAAPCRYRRPAEDRDRRGHRRRSPRAPAVAGGRRSRTRLIRAGRLAPLVPSVGPFWGPGVLVVFVCARVPSARRFRRRRRRSSARGSRRYRRPSPRSRPCRSRRSRSPAPASGSSARLSWCAPPCGSAVGPRVPTSSSAARRRRRPACPSPGEAGGCRASSAWSCPSR